MIGGELIPADGGHVLASAPRQDNSDVRYRRTSGWLRPPFTGRDRRPCHRQQQSAERRGQVGDASAVARIAYPAPARDVAGKRPIVLRQNASEAQFWLRIRIQGRLDQYRFVARYRLASGLARRPAVRKRQRVGHLQRTFSRGAGVSVG